MNNQGHNHMFLLENSLPKSGDCLLCKKKDEEDIYIVFNLLYRVVTGCVYNQSKISEDNKCGADIIPLTDEEKEAMDPTDGVTSYEEKLNKFKEKISPKLLTELITSENFGQLLSEIFKTKYGSFNEACHHTELSMCFIKMMEISEADASIEKTLKHIERIDKLLQSIRRFKSEMESYHSEINDLSNHIISRLLTNHAQLIKKEPLVDGTHDGEDGEDEEDLDIDHENGDTQHVQENHPIDKKIKNFEFENGKSTHPSNFPPSSNGSNQNFGNSDISTDATSNFVSETRSKDKSSRYSSFKSKLPKKATDILKSWFLNNIQNPYPNHEAKEMLSKMTGLNKKQIQNWFTNSRKRFLEPLKKKVETSKPSLENNNETPSQVDSQNQNHVHDSIPTFEQKNQINYEISQPQIRFVKDCPPQVNPIYVTPIQLREPNQKNNNLMPNQVGPMIQGPAIVYQGYMPANTINPQGGSIVILNPYMMPQPQMMMNQYRQPAQNVQCVSNMQSMPNMIPMNASFMQYPQGNITIMNQPQMVGPSYLVPVQSMGMRGNNGNSNISANYNTINNNLYTNVNNIPGEYFDEKLARDPDVIQAKIHGNMQDPYQTHGLKQRSKPQLDGIYQTSKLLHKDDAKEQN